MAPFVAACLLLAPASLVGVQCDVPATHATPSAAVADGSCTEIVIAAGTFPDEVEIARNLVMRGAGADQTTIEGTVRVTGAEVVVALEDMTVETTNAICPASPVSVDGGARTTGVGLVARPVVCAIFNDGFESGTPDAWDAVVP